jgi:hypothetical protein
LVPAAGAPEMAKVAAFVSEPGECGLK